jgi:hypothetical protein
LSFMSNHVIHVKSCHSCQIMSFMSNHVIHVKSCQIMSFMSNHVIHVKSCHSCQIMSFMSKHVIHVKSCQLCQVMSNHVIHVKSCHSWLFQEFSKVGRGGEGRGVKKVFLSLRRQLRCLAEGKNANWQILQFSRILQLSDFFFKLMPLNKVSENTAKWCVRHTKQNLCVCSLKRAPK